MPRTPELWENFVIANLQSQEDAKYAEALNQYKAASDNWITNGIHARDIGASVAPFDVPVPKRAVVSADENVIGQRVYTYVQDPNVHPPVLPPPVQQLPSGGLGTDVGVRDQVVLNMLAQIADGVSAIRKAMKV